MNALIEILNSAGQGFAQFAGPMLLQSSVLMAVLIGLDRLLRRQVRAVVRYALLCLVLVKLVLPPSLALPTGPGYWLALARSAEVRSPVEMAANPGPAVAVKSLPATTAVIESAPPATPRLSMRREVGALLSWRGGLFLVWLAGVMALLIWVVRRSRHMAGLVARGEDAAPALQSLLEACGTRLAIRRKVVLKLSDDFSSPAVCGLFRPVILISKALAEGFSHEQLEAVMLHELGHIKRGDVWVSHLQAMLQIVYWYHPLLWAANAMLRRVREEAVDELVMVTMQPRSETYPATLLAVAKLGFMRRLSGLGLVGIAESGRGLKERIQQLVSRPVPKTSKLGLAGVMLCLLVAALLLPMARGAAGRKDSEAGLGKRLDRGLTEGAVPLTPALSLGEREKRGPGVGEAAGKPEEPGWSEPIEGISLRLRLDETRWSMNQTPALNLDLRNQGQGDFITYQFQEMGSLEVDGTWYTWLGSGTWHQTPLPPGARFEGIAVTLTPDWRPKQDGTTNARSYLPLKLVPGQHTVRFAMTLTDAKAPRGKAIRGTPPPVIVTSDPVRFEVLPYSTTTGSRPISYQWRRKGSNVAETTSAAWPGVSVGLGSDHFAWAVEDAVLFHASVENQGTNEFRVVQAQEAGELELDGVSYVWGEAIDVKTSTLPPGRQYTNVAVTLTDRWRTKDGKPLRVGNGRHTVRFVMLATPVKGQEQTSPLRAASNPVQINLGPGIAERAGLVKKHIPGFELRAVRRGTGEKETLVEVLVAPSGTEVDLEAVRGAWRGTTASLPPADAPHRPFSSPVYWRNSKLSELLAALKLSPRSESDAEEVARLLFGLFKGPYAVFNHTLKAERSETGWVVTPTYTGPPAQVMFQGPLELLMEDGMVRDVRQRGFFGSGPSPTPVKDGDEAGWGEAVEGVSVRLRANKPILYLAESHELRLSVRNLGKATVLVPEFQELGELEMDGVWYSWPSHSYVARKPLSPGSQFESIPVSPTTWDWRKDSQPIHSQEGKHKFRFAFPIGPADANGKMQRVISNLVEAEYRFGLAPRQGAP